MPLGKSLKSMQVLLNEEMARLLADIEVVGDRLRQHRRRRSIWAAQRRPLLGRHLDEMVALAAIGPDWLMDLLVGAGVVHLGARQHDDADLGIDQMLALQAQSIFDDQEMIRRPGAIGHRRQRCSLGRTLMISTSPAASTRPAAPAAAR